jgi:hypothetical protein
MQRHAAASEKTYGLCQEKHVVEEIGRDTLRGAAASKAAFLEKHPRSHGPRWSRQIDTLR